MIFCSFQHVQSDEKRKQMYAKQGPDLSNPMLDLYDCKKETPYAIEELLKDKGCGDDVIKYFGQSL